MPSSHAEQHQSTFAALHHRHQLEAARSRRYRQRQKNKRQGGVDGRVARPPFKGRLQPGERVMRFAPTYDPSGDSSPDRSTFGENSSANCFADRSVVVGRLLRVLHARQRHSWISFGRALSYLGCPIMPAQRGCFCTYNGHVPHIVDGRRAPLSSPRGLLVKSWWQGHHGEAEEDQNNEGQGRGGTRLSVLARAAAMRAVEEDFRYKSTRGPGDAGIHEDMSHSGPVVRLSVHPYFPFLTT